MYAVLVWSIYHQSSHIMLPFTEQTKIKWTNIYCYKYFALIVAHIHKTFSEYFTATKWLCWSLWLTMLSVWCFLGYYLTEAILGQCNSISIESVCINPSKQLWCIHLMDIEEAVRAEIICKQWFYPLVCDERVRVPHVEGLGGSRSLALTWWVYTWLPVY